MQGPWNWPEFPHWQWFEIPVSRLKLTVDSTGNQPQVCSERQASFSLYMCQQIQSTVRCWAHHEMYSAAAIQPHLHCVDGVQFLLHCSSSFSTICMALMSSHWTYTSMKRCQLVATSTAHTPFKTTGPCRGRTTRASMSGCEQLWPCLHSDTSQCQWHPFDALQL